MPWARSSGGLLCKSQQLSMLCVARRKALMPRQSRTFASRRRPFWRTTAAAASEVSVMPRLHGFPACRASGSLHVRRDARNQTVVAVGSWPSTAHHDGQVAGCFSPQCALRHPGPRSWPTQVDPERHGTPATAALHDDTARAARAAIRSSFMLSTYSLLSTSCSSTRSMKARARAGCALRLKPCFAASDDGCRLFDLDRA